MWIKIDVGYGRVGIDWKNSDAVAALAREVSRCENMRFEGLLTHSGHSYGARGMQAIREIYTEGRERMVGLQEHLAGHGIQADLSFGDTPTCSTVENFEGFDEMRPGNFVFYDLVQAQIGSCHVDDIAVATACPVLGVYPDRGKIAVYGGSVHLSKDSMTVEGERLFGRLALPVEAGWRLLSTDEAKVVTCCQEVSTLQVSPSVMDRVSVGQFLLIVPVHACLTSEMNAHYLTPEGQRLDRFVLKG